ncbi:MAG TPA: hypothetical protein ENN38_05755 [Actinobacteria bacterium]|nr:hypothetical protein [Actinomycetota bacterium]
MKLQIQKLGNRHVILNLPVDIPDRFTLLVDEKQIPRRRRKKSKTKNVEIQAIREKYPELKVLDDMLKGFTVNENDEELLAEYYTQRARDEGII